LGRILLLSAAQVDVRSDWRRSVPYYRLYFLDRRGRFGRVEGFAAEDDLGAVVQAEKHGDTVKELWCGGRRVKQWGEKAA
jgi:hypothetical protein